MEYLSGLIGAFPVLGLFTLIVLGALGLPFPEDATLLLCGFLIANDVVAPGPAMAVVFAGLMSTDYFLYAIGRKYGEKIVAHPRFRRIMSEETLLRLEDKFRKRGGMIILFGRHLMGLRAQLFLVAGVMKMPPHVFGAFDAFSAALTMVLFVGLGYMGGESYETLKQDISRIEHLVTFVVILAAGIAVTVWFFRHRDRAD
ncbi:MAG: DedA family protein [Thermodesulfovibrionales bacterium]